ncbi:hypothetical protein B5F40_02690 [Gordonibacter sp. An230]|uniref:type III-A CRISPR-associated CARF protein Csm6 n=1 Tax=Gordonibacter sp. An230 TaxID=1965592 RepID=UPI000B3AC640|nr:hypothetical protein [Gordonibacter sp. An230]OUO91761.1 hypothetical protein B5F40_02690 [Gordonibacter sp. An230]
MRILFSPVGTADPLSTLGDGPMLHIVRRYRPEKIILFLSPAMAAYESRDERYTRAIRLLAAEIGEYGPEVGCIESASTEVHRYDLFIKEFDELLAQLEEEDPDAEILLNVTSGTPAMQQALVAIDAFGHRRLRAVQVETPRKGINEPGDREKADDYDFDTLWEMNPDREGDAQNRCREVESANFSDLVLRDNIRAFVEGYDYVAALRLAKQCRSISFRATTLIEGCVYRSRLDRQRAIPCFKGTAFPCDSPETTGALFEYLSVLEVYLQREQWADYLRAMTPALTELMLKRVRVSIPDREWLLERSGKITRRIDSGKVDRNDDLRRVLKPKGENPYVTNGHLAKLIEYFANSLEYEPYKKLRTLEKKARHRLAHEVGKVDKASIEKAGGISLEESLDIMFKLDGSKQGRGLYRRINGEVIQLLQCEVPRASVSH